MADEEFSAGALGIGVGTASDVNDAFRAARQLIVAFARNTPHTSTAFGRGTSLTIIVALMLHDAYARDTGIATLETTYELATSRSANDIFCAMLDAAHDRASRYGWVDTVGNPVATHPFVARVAHEMLGCEESARDAAMSAARAYLRESLNPRSVVAPPRGDESDWTLLRVDADASGVSTLAPDIIRAYHNTDYRVRDADQAFTLTIGVRSPEVLDRYARYNVQTASFMTAWNPQSRMVPESVNLAAQTNLRRSLQSADAVIIEASGEDATRRWPAEPSFLVFGISDCTACALGRQFGQNAILLVDADAIPKLALLR